MGFRISAVRCQNLRAPPGLVYLVTSSVPAWYASATSPCRYNGSADLSPALQRPAQCQLIGVLEVAADR